MFDEVRNLKIASSTFGDQVAQNFTKEGIASDIEEFVVGADPIEFEDLSEGPAINSSSSPAGASYRFASLSFRV